MNLYQALVKENIPTKFETSRFLSRGCREIIERLPIDKFEILRQSNIGYGMYNHIFTYNYARRSVECMFITFRALQLLEEDLSSMSKDKAYEQSFARFEIVYREARPSVQRDMMVKLYKKSHPKQMKNFQL